MTARARELLEIVGKATPGPWKAEGRGGMHMDGSRDGYMVTFVNEDYGGPYLADMRHHDRFQRGFNAAAIACLPDLAAELRAALDEIERLKGEAEQPYLQPPPVSCQKCGIARHPVFQKWSACLDQDCPPLPTDAGVPVPTYDESGFGSGASIIGDAQGGDE